MPAEIAKLAAGETYIKHFPAPRVREMTDSGRFAATADFAELADVDAVLICVPTPLTATMKPSVAASE